MRRPLRRTSCRRCGQTIHTQKEGPQLCQLCADRWMQVVLFPSPDNLLWAVKRLFKGRHG